MHAAGTIFNQSHKHPDASINSGYLHLAVDETFHRPVFQVNKDENNSFLFTFERLQEIDSLWSQKTASVLLNKVERAASQNFPRTLQNNIDVKESVKKIKWRQRLLTIANEIMRENATVWLIHSEISILHLETCCFCQLAHVLPLKLNRYAQ